VRQVLFKRLLFGEKWVIDSLEGGICSGGFMIHNPKVGGSIPPPATNKIN